MARIAGQMIEMIYALLKSDAELLSRTQAGVAPAVPMRYDPQVHQAHRQGHYRPLKQVQRASQILRLPDRVSQTSQP